MRIEHWLPEHLPVVNTIGNMAIPSSYKPATEGCLLIVPKNTIQRRAEPKYKIEVICVDMVHTTRSHVTMVRC